VFTNESNAIKLTEAASGIQSVLPILIPILYRRNKLEHQSFVIEEPELNLFPLAQYDLLQYLEESRLNMPWEWEDVGTIHTYTTHSPYILAALNNFLYVNKVKQSIPSRNENEFKMELKETVTAEIDPDHFTAYQISNGSAEAILDRETGLIKENFIDEASDKIGDDFDVLMELQEKYKN
jgi:predicted ATP-dependent endonuclease of OLD family